MWNRCQDKYVIPQIRTQIQDSCNQYQSNSGLGIFDIMAAIEKLNNRRPLQKGES
jgi:hypothetical protein